MRRSSELFAEGFEKIDAALALSRAELALSESRVAQLKAAAELEHAGEAERAAELVARVREEQEAEG